MGSELPGLKTPVTLTRGALGTVVIEGIRMRFGGSTALPWQRRGPEGGFTTRSGPDNMVRHEAIRL